MISSSFPSIDPENDPTLDCYTENDPESLALPYWIYIGSSSLISLILIACWIFKREWFPLKERSPFLVIATIIGNLLIQISYPIVFIKFQDKADLDVLKALYHVGCSLLFTPYLFRGFRLDYAFSWHRDSKKLEFIFSRQYLLFFMCIFIAIIFGLLMIVIFGDASLPYFVHGGIEAVSESLDLTTYVIKTSIYFVQMVTLALTAYMLRHVKSEYNFKKEIMLALLLNVVAFNIASYFYQDMNKCNGVLYFPNVMILMNLRGWLMMISTAYYPLTIATRLHYLLPQRFVIDIFQNFLGDETCIKAFDRFINCGAKKENTMVSASAYEPSDEIELFRVFVSLRERIIIGKSNSRIIEKMMNEFIRNEKVKDLFPANYIFEIKNMYEEDRDELRIESFDKLHGFCIYYFQEVFETRFRKTRSFSYIKNIFKNNEHINRRLHTLKLVSVK